MFGLDVQSQTMSEAVTPLALPLMFVQPLPLLSLPPPLLLSVALETLLMYTPLNSSEANGCEASSGFGLLGGDFGE